MAVARFWGRIRKRAIPPAPWAPKALVVVHGIGVQAPGATLRAFTDGLTKVRDCEIYGAVREPVKFGEKHRAVASQVVWRGSSDGADQMFDLYEIYWAPRASGKTTARSVLAWILRLTFIPGSKIRRGRLKNLYDAAAFLFLVVGASVLLLGTLIALGNLTRLADCLQPDPERTPEQIEACEEAFAEQGFQVTPASENLQRRGDVQEAILAEPSSRLERLGAVGGTLWRSVSSAPRRFFSNSLEQLSVTDAVDVAKAIPLDQLLLIAAIVWIAAQVFYRIVQVALTGTAGERFQAGIGLLLQIVALGLILQFLTSIWILLVSIVTLVLVRVMERSEPTSRPAKATRKVVVSVDQMFILLGITMLALLAQETDPIYAAFALLLAFAWLVVRWTSGFLSESLGDVQVYTTRNPNSPRWAAREEILADAERVFEAVSHRGYQSILIVGHSLGAVIALEAVDNLKYRVPDLWPRIRGFVTTGAAVEKVRYFFGQDPSTETPAVEGSVEEPHDEATLAQQGLESAMARTGTKPWLNLWFSNDIIADPIFSFADTRRQPRCSWGKVKVDDRLSGVVRECPLMRVVNIRFSPRGLWSHGKYWTDKRVCQVIARAAEVWPDLQPPDEDAATPTIDLCISLPRLRAVLDRDQSGTPAIAAVAPAGERSDP